MVTLVREQIRTMPNATPSTIREILAEQGIVPFSPELIDRYKSWQLRRHTPLRSQLIWFAVMKLQSVALSLLVGGFSLTYTGINLLQTQVAIQLGQSLQALGNATMWLTLATGIIWFICWRIFGRTHVPYPYWVKIERESWGGVLPPHAAETARLIQEHLPGKIIFIDLLLYEDVEVDPIMFIYDEHGKRLNLEVWGPNVPPV